MPGSLASEIKKIVPWDNTSPLPEYFESVLEDEVWIKIKIDQIAAQFVACGLNQPRNAHSCQLFS